MQVPEEDMRRRAEHLRAQRDALMAKRKADRERELTDFHKARNAAAGFFLVSVEV